MESQTNVIDSNKQKFNLQAVFPTPIYIAKLERNIVKTELDFCHAELKKSIKNISNLSSQNQYVLENEPFRDLKICITKLAIDLPKNFLNNILVNKCCICVF